MKSIAEYFELANEYRLTKNEINRLNKDIRRKLSFYCLNAAHNLQMAEYHSCCIQKTSLNEAERISDLINIFIDKDEDKTTPYQFMKSPEDEANKSIKYYNLYRTYLDNLPDYKRVIEGFSRWYLNCYRETVKIKYYYQYIEYVATAILLKDLHRIDDKELNKMLDDLRRTSNKLYDFRPVQIKRSFIQVMQKVDEISEKVSFRIKSKSVLKVVYQSSSLRLSR